MFGAVNLAENKVFDKYIYSGYGSGFDRQFSVGKGFRRNCIIFGADMSSYVHPDDKKKDILILAEGTRQGQIATTFNGEKMYSINFTENIKKFCFSLYYNGENRYLLINGL